MARTYLGGAKTEASEPTPQAEQAPRASARPLYVGLALLAILLAFSVLRYAPPAPKPADAPLTEFSGSRVYAILQELLSGGLPRPAGRAANAQSRSELVARLEAVDYAPTMQRGFACTQWGSQK